MTILNYTETEKKIRLSLAMIKSQYTLNIAFIFIQQYKFTQVVKFDVDKKNVIGRCIQNERLQQV